MVTKYHDKPKYQNATYCILICACSLFLVCTLGIQKSLTTAILLDLNHVQYRIVVCRILIFKFIMTISDHFLFLYIFNVQSIVNFSFLYYFKVFSLLISFLFKTLPLLCVLLSTSRVK